MSEVIRAYGTSRDPDFDELLEKCRRHRHIICDECQLPIGLGDRWKCIECPNYDLCDKCKDLNPPVHPHQFRKIEDSRRESPQASRRESETNSYKATAVSVPDYKRKREEQLKHAGITCDGCKCLIVKGNRWKCTECPDYDLCDECMTEDPPVHSHQFRKIEDSRIESLST